MSTAPLDLVLGLKTDPIEYRYSFDWLFRLAAREGVHHLQLGSFFEVYQLPDEFFRDLKKKAADHGVAFTSLFTAHRELGGFFRDDGPGFVELAHKNFARFIQVGALLGAQSVGHNPGAVLRDRMGTKPAGVATYIRHFKELMHTAHDAGIEWLTIEPMSCLAEPPTLPEEMQAMGEELAAYHAAHPGKTAKVGFCVDIAHGYCDADKKVVHDPIALLLAALPWTSELHLKNTDAHFNSTFGFSAAERQRGIVHLESVGDLLRQHAQELPTPQLIGYLEIGGPKTGRDYSDPHLESMLVESLRHCKKNYEGKQEARSKKQEAPTTSASSWPLTPGPSSPTKDSGLSTKDSVFIAPSIMCADQLHLEDDIRRLEAIGAEILHFDLMDSHFTPNMPLGLVTLEQLRSKTATPFDAHLMVETNDWFVGALGKIGVQYISVHVESCTHLDRTLALIRDAGARAGAALNPATPLSALDFVLDRLDFVLIMTVNPGFAGQKLVPAGLQKIAAARQFLDAHSPHRRILLQVDGNVSFENIPGMVAAGADILVAGTSSLFSKSASLKDNAARTRAAIAQGLTQRPTRADH